MVVMHETLIYAVYYAPRGRLRLYRLGRDIAERHLFPTDLLVGIIGAEGAGKSTLIRGVFPGLELTNDDEGINLRAAPLFDFDEADRFGPHTYHIDVRYEQAFHQLWEIAEAVATAIRHRRRVVVEHFDLLYPHLNFNAQIILGIGEEVVVLDRLSTGFRWAVDPRAVFVQGAIEDDALVRRTVREHAIGGVLHFAGSTVAPESVADPLKYYRNNTAASRSLLESVIGEGVRHFVFSSTAAVYGVTPERPVTERDRVEPETPYGRSKLMTERMLADIAVAKADFNYCALRYFNVAGADPKGRTARSLRIFALNSSAV